MHFDKRTIRMLHSSEYRSTIMEDVDRHGRAAHSRPIARNDASQFCVCVRKRPLLPHELKKGQYDVIHALGSSSIRVYDCRREANARVKYIDRKTFAFDQVFSEQHSTADVYAAVVRSAIHSTMRLNQSTTVLMFGQTGSGKTFTMSEIRRIGFKDIFAAMVQLKASHHLRLAAFEVQGQTATDLLAGGREIKIFESAEDIAIPCIMKGLSYMSCPTPHMLENAVERAASVRQTAATGEFSLPRQCNATPTLADLSDYCAHVAESHCSVCLVLCCSRCARRPRRFLPHPLLRTHCLLPQCRRVPKRRVHTRASNDCAYGPRGPGWLRA